MDVLKYLYKSEDSFASGVSAGPLRAAVSYGCMRLSIVTQIRTVVKIAQKNSITAQQIVVIGLARFAAKPLHVT